MLAPSFAAAAKAGPAPIQRPAVAAPDGNETTETPRDPGAGGEISAPEADSGAGTDAPGATEPGATTVPEPEADAVPEPAAAPAEPASPADAVPEPATTAPTSGAIDPDLLGASEPEPEAEAVAPVPSRPAGSPAPGTSPEERAAALKAAYTSRYRPADNPTRLNIAGRLMFANVGGKEHVNGRMGGAAIDVGPAWNHVGVAASFTGWGGRVLLPPETGAEINGMFGGGLSVGLGRLALLSRGFLDLRLGYDVYYGAVNQRSDAPTILAPQADDPRLVAEFTENLLPHGPRVRLDLGLLGAGNRRFFHGFGMSMGYQGLVGSFRGDLPPTNMLTLGISYWMG